MPNIFISYRREDSAGHTGRLFDRLSQRFGKDHVFMDVAGIEPGEDFVEAIKRAVSACDVFIAVIGRQWLDVGVAGGRRPGEAEDYIRLEIATALQLNKPLIPALVQGAAMPSAERLPEELRKLPRQNAIEISDSRWDYDVGRLIQRLEKVLKEPPAPKVPSDLPPTPKFPRWAMAMIILLIGGIVALWHFWPKDRAEKYGVVVPRVVGQMADQAQATLEGAQLKVGKMQGITAQDKPSGMVLEQNPLPGQRVERSQKVDLWVAAKPEPKPRPVIQVPKVVDLQLELAVARLKERGLEVGPVENIPTGEKPPGMVLSQRPPAGEQVERGQKVHLEVAAEIANNSKIVYEAPFSTWPKVRNEHGYVGAEGNYYVMEATSNTWMGPGYLPITLLNGDFIIDVSFKVIYRENCSINFILSDAGRDYSQLSFFFDLWQSSTPTFSIYENWVQNDFYVNTKQKFAERTPIKQDLSLVDWTKVNTLSVKRASNNISFYLNGKLLHSFLSPTFPVKKLGLGIAFKSRILLASVKAGIPR